MSRFSGRVHVHIPYPILLERLDEVQDKGLNPEIFLSSEHLDNISLADVREIKRAFVERGLQITLHGPYMDLNPSAVDERVRGVTCDRFQQLFQVAEILNPLIIVMHAGYDRRRYDDNELLWLRQGIKTWPAFVEMAERIGTTIAIENVFDEKPDTIKMLIDSINSPNFRVCFDPGHWNIFSKLPLTVWLNTLGKDIVEVHVHDNHGERDEHVAIGEGGIDFKSLFIGLQKAVEKIIFTIEAHDEETAWGSLKKLNGFII